MDYTKIIKEIGRGKHHARSLDQPTALALYRAMLAGEVPDLELGGILIAFRIKAEAEEEMLGFYQAMQERVMPLQAPADMPPPIVIPSYNGARKQANLTPLLAMALSTLGFPVVVHGVSHDPARVTSAEIFRALGIHPPTRREDAQSALIMQRKPLFLPIKLMSPEMDSQLNLRWRMGVRNSAHTLAKLATPFHHHLHWRLASVSHPEYVPRVAAFFTAINASGLLMNGTEGETYANPQRMARIIGLHRGEQELLLDPQQYPLPPLSSQPEGRDALSTARWTEACLRGELALPDAIRLQLACCLKATGQADGIASALDTIDRAFSPG
ncbi:DNA-binding protein YbiB [Biostraticola tofi]|uniref:Anthranilate phosphoribosyltransferase n=1 Tax=Biostraticola tofi TaxID=466109 RepID=A0A4R3Z1H8_9GAMM|nr:DNA-binding protein YbiB [Biostraticola tofi]TCV98078.1 anthranilate phosphoribosyltransferase [Biostraticola tofi]